MEAASILEVRNATLGFSFSWELMTLAPVGSHPDSTIVAAKFTGLWRELFVVFVHVACFALFGGSIPVPILEIC